MSLTAYEVALAPIGFSLKTKALASLIKGNTKKFDLLRVNLTSFGEPESTADVWAVMLLNYQLNGSKPNFNGVIRSCSFTLTEERYSADARAKAFEYFKSTVAPRTFNRWKEALVIIKQVAEAQSAPAVRDLTLSEIQNLLGYKVRIVA